VLSPLAVCVLQVGNTEITAVEHPLKGVALIFTSVGGRSAYYFESSAPTYASSEQIATLIYSNLAMNIPADARTCKVQFQELGIFQ
jgi:hypothetical protein